jgi:hypothetical protein
MKKQYFLGIALVLLVGMMGCSKDSGKTGRLARPISDDQLRQELTTLTDTLTGKWNVMMQSDSVKQRQMEEMLAAIPPAAMADSQRASLQHAIRRLSALRYDRNTVRDSNRIDAYDTANDSIWSALRAFLPENGPTGVQLVDSLQQSISNHQNEVVFYRGRYDQTAKEINTLLRRYRKQVPKLGKPYDTLQAFPLFQWVDKNAQPTEEDEEE